MKNLCVAVITVSGCQQRINHHITHVGLLVTTNLHPKLKSLYFCCRNIKVLSKWISFTLTVKEQLNSSIIAGQVCVSTVTNVDEIVNENTGISQIQTRYFIVWNSGRRNISNPVRHIGPKTLGPPMDMSRHDDRDDLYDKIQCLLLWGLRLFDRQ